MEYLGLVIAIDVLIVVVVAAPVVDALDVVDVVDVVVHVEVDAVDVQGIVDSHAKRHVVAYVDTSIDITDLLGL